MNTPPLPALGSDVVVTSVCKQFERYVRLSLPYKVVGLDDGVVSIIDESGARLYLREGVAEWLPVESQS